MMKLRVLEICKEKGITQKGLAAIVGMSPVGISRALGGNTTRGTLEKIANALDVSIVDLFEAPKKDYLTCPHCGKDIYFEKKS
jgi:transcriptional regulator with XRE-family HTH domain